MGSVVAVDGLSTRVRVDGCDDKWAGWVGRLVGFFFLELGLWPYRAGVSVLGHVGLRESWVREKGFWNGSRFGVSEMRVGSTGVGPCEAKCDLAIRKWA